MQKTIFLRNTEVLNYKTPKAVIIQSLILAAALVLPALCHYLALPVTKFVPMHWPILFAGLLYGRKSGFLLGLAAPLISFMISGMPAGHMLPIMSAELAAYGFFSGFFKEQFKLSSFISLILALVCGKALYMLTAFALGGGISFAFMKNALPAVLAQIIILPLLADKCASKK